MRSPLPIVHLSKTRMNDLSCGIRMWAQVCFVLSPSTRLSDGQPDAQKGLGNTVRCITCSRAVKTEVLLSYTGLLLDLLRNECSHIQYIRCTNTLTSHILKIHTDDKINQAPKIELSAQNQSIHNLLLYTSYPAHHSAHTWLPVPVFHTSL